MTSGWFGLLMLTVGWVVGFGGYWLAEKLAPAGHDHCARCGAKTPPGVDVCWECAEMQAR